MAAALLGAAVVTMASSQGPHSGPAGTAVPKWPPTFNMSESTCVMPCNYTGLYDFDAYPDLAKFGLVDYDWANAKTTWVDNSPMNTDDMLVEQAARNKAQNPSAKVFVYRNIVKALPWYTEVRELLQNQAYWGWFIPYEGCKQGDEYVCKDNVTGAIDASANLYHDEEQTPGWTGGGNGGPDGVCHGDTKGNTGKGCDCGTGVSCGEYLFNHRNQSLTAWLTDEYMGGAKYGLGNKNVDGFFLDDNWHNSPSEEAWPISPRGTGSGRSAGLTPQEIKEMNGNWSHNMDACQKAIVDHDGFNWQLFKGGSTPAKSKCVSEMRSACKPDSVYQTHAVQYGIGYKYFPDFSGGNLTHFDLDLGIFLAVRGNYSWLGYAWMGCGCGWEHNGKMPCDIYQRPAALDVDYGVPTELCKETSTGVFTREWTKSTVTVDCHAYTTDIKMK